MTIGVELKRTKLILIGLSALLTGASVAFAGVIGFIDLIAPHVVRRIFGSSHKLVVPMSALFGGAFMALADLLARWALSLHWSARRFSPMSTLRKESGCEYAGSNRSVRRL